MQASSWGAIRLKRGHFATSTILSLCVGHSGVSRLRGGVQPSNRSQGREARQVEAACSANKISQYFYNKQPCTDDHIEGNQLILWSGHRPADQMWARSEEVSHCDYLILWIFGILNGVNASSMTEWNDFKKMRIFCQIAQKTSCGKYGFVENLNFRKVTKYKSEYFDYSDYFQVWLGWNRMRNVKSTWTKKWAKRWKEIWVWE